MAVTTSIQTPVLNASPKTRLDYLDGIRGLAALFVVAHHLWQNHTMGALPGFSGVLRNWLLYGHLSVDVFIVLSGACLMLPVARSGSLRGGWQAFYKSRARRILPPLYITIAFAWAAYALQGGWFPPHMVVINLLLLQDLLPKKNLLDVPLWSVALEWRIYFLFPLFVWLWSRYGSPAVLLLSAVIGYGLAAILSVADPSLHQALACSWYVFLFGMGMAATSLAQSRQRSLTEQTSYRTNILQNKHLTEQTSYTDAVLGCCRLPGADAAPVADYRRGRKPFAVSTASAAH